MSCKIVVALRQIERVITMRKNAMLRVFRVFFALVALLPVPLVWAAGTGTSTEAKC